MEKLSSFARNGVLRLPPGFRFHPTDEELVVQYLKRKVMCFPLPASIIPEFDVCRADPWDLPGDSEQERYFFSMREAKYPNGNRSNRATGSGYWKATGLDKQILSSSSPRGSHVVVGFKKTLVFYRGKPPHGSRTDWIMHEYRLATATTQQINNSQDTVVPTENWVLCRIFLKKRGSKNEDDAVQSINLNNNVVRIRSRNINMTNNDNNININNNNNTSDSNTPVFYEFLRKGAITDLNLAPSSSSSGSSGVTEVSSDESSDDREASSSCKINVTCFRRKD